MYRVEVDWAPPYELTVSLAAFLGGADQKVMDLGPTWARDLRKRLDPTVPALLPGPGKKWHGDLIDLLIWQCPGEREIPSFLDWVCSLSLGELYERLAPHAREQPHGLPRDLISVRDHLVELLRAWNDQYCREIDPAVQAGL